MTSTPVKDVGAGAGGMLPVNTKHASGGGFQAVWNSQAKKQTTGNETEESAGAVKKTPGDSLKARDEHRARTEKREPSRNVEERADIPEEKLEEAAEVFALAAAGLLQEIPEILGVSAEELQESMEALGMETIDLLSPGKLGELLLQTKGAEDASALLTDEEIYESYQELTALLAEKLQESGQKLESSPGEMGQMLEQLKAREGSGSPAEPVIIVETVKEPKAAADETGREDGENAALRSVQQIPETGVEGAGEKNAAEGRSEGRQEHRGKDQEQGPGLFVQNLRAQQFEPQIRPESAVESTRNIDTENIMRQIMDYMKIQLKPEVSSMEMQLHPASLGTLQVQIASKGGVITANFLTQNEAVKAALESQLVQLREQFEERGVRVEAIEVTVQTHEFERNLDQGRGNNGQDREPARRGRARRIRLDGPGAGEEPEELLAGEIPAASGNTVDYTA